MRVKSLLSSLLVGMAALPCFAEIPPGYFDHLDVGVSVGTAGLGLDFAMPVSEWTRIRTGFTFMPHFQLRSNFGVEFDDSRLAEIEEDYHADMIRRMKKLMSSMSGYNVEDNVDMLMEPTWSNFKFLVDVMPFRNKDWKLTVGFYAGGSRIGKAVNAVEYAPTLNAVGMYNSFYQKAYKGEPFIEYEDYTHETHDVDLPTDFVEKFMEVGMMGMPLGHFKDGDKAIMVPDKNGVASAEMHVNKFRPYIGAAYTTSLSRDGKLKMNADAGFMLWGGAPHVYVDNIYKVNPEQENTMVTGYWGETPNGRPMWVWEQRPTYRIDLTRDVEDIKGKTGRWVDFVKNVVCYPMVSVTFSYSLF